MSKRSLEVVVAYVGEARNFFSQFLHLDGVLAGAVGKC